MHNRLDDFERDGRVPANMPLAMTPSGSRLSLNRDWEEVRHEVASELPSSMQKDSIDWEIEAKGEDDEEEPAHKTQAFLKWQAKRDERDRHVILWGEQQKSEKLGMAPRDPLSASGRPVDVRLHGLEAEGSHASSSLSLGAKQPALVPYGDEPYSDPPRRFGSVSV